MHQRLLSQHTKKWRGGNNMKRLLLIVILLLTFVLGFGNTAYAAAPPDLSQASGRNQTIIAGTVEEGWVYPLPLESWQWGYSARGIMVARYTRQPDTASVQIVFTIPGERKTVVVKLQELDWINEEPIPGIDIWINGYWDVYVNGKLFLDNVVSGIGFGEYQGKIGWKIHAWSEGNDVMHVWGYCKIVG
jgi:hypothetical protein